MFMPCRFFKKNIMLRICKMNFRRILSLCNRMWKHPFNSSNKLFIKLIITVIARSWQFDKKYYITKQKIHIIHFAYN